MKNIAIIPARSGTKSLKDKNIKMLNGKPLLEYSIRAAVDSGMFAQVHVSTDSEVYANIARERGADVPFLRPEELATDDADSWDVVRYVLKEYQKMEQYFDTVALLQPTSPFRNALDIIAAYQIYEQNRANSVISLCEMEHTPLWSNVLPENHSMKDFISAKNDVRRQDLPVYYRQNGAIYVVNVQLILNYGNLYGEDSYAYIMDQKRSVDIDTVDDFEYAEFLLEKAYVTGSSRLGE